MQADQTDQTDLEMIVIDTETEIEWDKGCIIMIRVTTGTQGES